MIYTVSQKHLVLNFLQLTGFENSITVGKISELALIILFAAS